MNVWRLSKSLGSKSKVPVVNAAVTYTCEYTGESVMLLINNALYFEDMKHNLNPPFMIRLASAEVNECPKCQRKFPRIEDHSIYFPNDDSHEDRISNSATIIWYNLILPNNYNHKERVN